MKMYFLAPGSYIHSITAIAYNVHDHTRI